MIVCMLDVKIVGVAEHIGAANHQKLNQMLFVLDFHHGALLNDQKISLVLM